MMILFVFFYVVSFFKVVSIKIFPIESSDKYVSQNYLELYSIPSDLIVYSTNRKKIKGQKISKTFDKDFNTFWRALGTQNNINDNQIIFLRKVSFDKLLFQYQKGYPTTLRLHFSNKTKEFTQEISFKNQQDSGLMIIDFEKNITCKKVKLEFDKELAIQEIIFLQSEKKEDTKIFERIFTDFNWMTLSNEITSINQIKALRKKYKTDVNYERYFKFVLDRAEMVLQKEIKFEPKRYFSTGDKSQGTIIPRLGDQKSYAEKVLKMRFFGTNRLITGIYGIKGQNFTIFIGGKNSDKFPTIVFTDVYSENSFKKFPLKKGFNFILFPEFRKDSTAGGPIYLENGFLPEDQSSEVLIYIEGGALFPVFRRGGNEKEYITALKSFIKKEEKTIHLTELQGNHAILTIQLDLAKQFYLEEKKNPTKIIYNWDKSIEKILDFEGIVFDSTREHYNQLNNHLSMNFRCGMLNKYRKILSYNEMINICNYRLSLLCMDLEGFGWEIAEQIGYSMDIPYRIMPDCSNTMISKFEEVEIRKSSNEGDFNGIRKKLAPDNIKHGTYWKNNKNFLIWWLIESYNPGYWGQFNNLYRYKDNGDYKGITETEKQIYFSSIILGFNISYYFERFGYTLNDKPFTYSSSTKEFKELFEKAVNETIILNETTPKIWYCDENQYQIRKNHVESIYSTEESIEVDSIERIKGKTNFLFSSEYQYNLVMPKPKDEIRHLGYEILTENEKKELIVIGFTNGIHFIDPKIYYTDALPRYIIKAYDRTLRFTGDKSTNACKSFCRIGDVEYNSLSEAIENASSADVIYLKRATYETGIKITKSVKIASELESISIKRKNSEPIFIVEKRGTLTIDDPKITIDGDKMLASGPLIQVKGTVNFTNINLVNSYNSENGGAIVIEYGGTGIFNSINFTNNMALNGGGIYCSSSEVKLLVTDSIFFKNTAKESGGGAWFKGKGKFKNTIFDSNIATEEGGAMAIFEGVFSFFESEKFSLISNITSTNNKGKKGGAFYLKGSSKIVDSKVFHNKANKGGGIYFGDSAKANVELQNTIIINNEAESGEHIYSSSSGTLKINNCKFTEQEKTELIEAIKNHAETLFTEKGNIEIQGEVPYLEFEEKESIFVESLFSGIYLHSNLMKIEIADVIIKDIKIFNKVPLLFIYKGESVVVFASNITEMTFNQINFYWIKVEPENFLLFTYKDRDYLDDTPVIFDEPETVFVKKLPNFIVFLKEDEENITILCRTRLNDTFIFPEFDRDKIPKNWKFLGWKVGKTIYQEKSEIKINDNITLIPVFKKSLLDIEEITTTLGSFLFLHFISAVVVVIIKIVKKKREVLVEEIDDNNNNNRDGNIELQRLERI